MINKTDIEYGDRAWNFQTGCLHGCPYCWARKLTERFSEAYPSGFEPTFHQDRFEDNFPKKPSRILVCFTGDLWGYWVDERVKLSALHRMLAWPQHKFLLLTKNPKAYYGRIFPSTCWVGVTATNQAEIEQRSIETVMADIRWLSLEPLFGPVREIPSYFDWVVVGAHTKPLTKPKKGWVKEIVYQCAAKNIPVFIKNNLCETDLEKTIFQEYPDVY